eukprot:CAMPEP_0118719112 /NCGR_PEP_ID=MMETSP0800-20121206/29236_1 /TAXON_ID=210618 ORGANISM="Striatella unipunctata, Strain CCMP2910" /NCGR_SAMPLE_ID=MMETSP0800 /ASSEMBLY_ACC=CAM_ASM_000638 /LENGTH=52 /DNA_ID=CAMNT_0006626329 /DNA_START=49 /DNA_END=204 /DNA_ORIENTATION=-
MDHHQHTTDASNPFVPRWPQGSYDRLAMEANQIYDNTVGVVLNQASLQNNLS